MEAGILAACALQTLLSLFVRETTETVTIAFSVSGMFKSLSMAFLFPLETQSDVTVFHKR